MCFGKIPARNALQEQKEKNEEVTGETRLPSRSISLRASRPVCHSVKSGFSAGDFERISSHDKDKLGARLVHFSLQMR